MATRSMFFDLHPTCRMKSAREIPNPNLQIPGKSRARRELPNPNFQIPGKSQLSNSKKAKAARRRARTPKAIAKQSSRLALISHAVLSECDASSHRFHLLNINALKRMYVISPPASSKLGFTAAPAAVSIAENNLIGLSGCDFVARTLVAPAGNP